MSSLFKKLDRKQTSIVLDKLNPRIEGSPFAAQEATVLSKNLSFYPGYQWLELSHHKTHPGRKLYAIYQHSKASPGTQSLKEMNPAAEASSIIVLNGQNDQIYNLNTALPIELDENNVKDYVRFFFASVRGRHGPFLIVDSVDEIKWLEEPPLPARKTVSKMLEPLRLVGTDSVEGSYQLRASVIHRDSLFKVQIVVAQNGKISIEKEELIMEEMPVLDEVLRF